MRSAWRIAAIILFFSTTVFSQDKMVKRTLVINGQSGEITVFRVDGHPFVDLETLARIGNATVSLEGNTITLTFSTPQASTPVPPQPPPDTMSSNFMSTAVQELGVLKEWRSMMAYGVTRGVPGNGSRMVLNQNKATEGLRMAKIAASTDADRSAYQLLANAFDHVNTWYEQLVQGRKNMNTGNYSMSEDPLKNDSQYQKIVTCSDFLGSMIPSGTFSDNGSCR